MPTYEYECQKCGSIQEVMHGITATLAVDCKICGGECHKIFSMNTNFVLKGGDWPSQGFRMKDQMNKKNSKMKSKMVERERFGESIKKMSDFK